MTPEHSTTQPISTVPPSEVGQIARINGPIVEARNMAEVGMLEVVEVGHLHLIGEVIRLRDGVATIQVYENTSGLRPGEPVLPTGRPLSLHLGPGLLGTIYDGIQRPLAAIAAESGPMIGRGQKPPPLDLVRTWPFEPRCREGFGASPSNRSRYRRTSDSVPPRNRRSRDVYLCPGNWGIVVNGLFS